MKPRTALLLRFSSRPGGCAVGPAAAHQGEPGLDPAQARGWLAPDYDRFGFALNNWREAVGFAPGQRMQLTTRSAGAAASAWGMGNDFDEQRQLSFSGRYSLTQDWALSAETLGRDATDLFRLQDIRIGVQRRF